MYDGCGVFGETRHFFRTLWSQNLSRPQSKWKQFEVLLNNALKLRNGDTLGTDSMSKSESRIKRLTHRRPPARIFLLPGLQKYSQRVAYSREALIVSLGNTLKIRDQDLRWRKTWVGKTLCKFERKTDPNAIEIDGMRLAQMLELVGEDLAGKISVSNHYSVDLEWFRSLIDRASNQIKRDEAS